MKGNDPYDYIVLGGGIAGLSLAEELQGRVLILESEAEIGGLCRSFDFNGVLFDIGPHIIFSKYRDILERHTTRVETNKLKRLNRILLNGKYIKYPFENDLSSCTPNDRDYALHSFLNNPYKNFDPSNMEQFFLKTFGEGICNLYLIPYNRKIWKFEPSFMDMQMVERIPSPPDEDVIASAEGKTTEGYVHQLFFHYPRQGGFQSLIDDYVYRISNRVEIVKSAKVTELERNTDNSWNVTAGSSSYTGNKVISTIPLPNLVKLLNPPAEILRQAKEMLFNSIYIVMLEIEGEILSDQFALYVPDASIIFHRLSRLNFLGTNYVPKSGGTVLMAEITYRKDMLISTTPPENLVQMVLEGLRQLGIMTNEKLIASKVMDFEHAYVIYDLNHRQRTDQILNWVANLGILATGRFGKFEYQNSDQVVYDSINLAENLK